MKPDEKTLREFKEEYKKEFGEDLTDQEAYEAFSHLVNVLRLLFYTPKNPPLDSRERYDNVRTVK
jgi:hypothetical protein